MPHKRSKAGMERQQARSLAWQNRNCTRHILHRATESLDSALVNAPEDASAYVHFDADDVRIRNLIAPFWDGLTAEERIALHRELAAAGFVNDATLDLLGRWVITQCEWVSAQSETSEHRSVRTLRGGLPSLGKRG